MAAPDTICVSVRTEAEKLFGRPKGFPERLGLDPWPIAEAQERFLERFRALDDAMRGA